VRIVRLKGIAGEDIFVNLGNATSISEHTKGTSKINFTGDGFVLVSGAPGEVVTRARESDRWPEQLEPE